jgi:hypothetical protein
MVMAGGDERQSFFGHHENLWGSSASPSQVVYNE